MAEKHCLVIGVGPGVGLHTVRAFRDEGYTVSMIARHAGRLESWAREEAGTHGYPADLVDIEGYKSVLRRIVDEQGLPDVIVYNAAMASFGAYEDITVESFETAFRVNATGLLVTAQTLCPAMVERGHGRLMVTGNTGSLRGKPNFIGWSPSKAGGRIVAEALARNLGPKNVHVAYIVIDALIDMPFARKRWPDLPDDVFAKPADLASEIYRVAHQPPSARSFLVEIRPSGEPW
ncbi:SDR family NAD(P)-dependent oxidoreductase [Minwuia sp.]|uniref:SDR family NAD(P)-dependent oxidoreductase n=1 Tax=Minwuia sp. TaxID=2493630 RepID=UPI003A9024EB